MCDPVDDHILQMDLRHRWRGQPLLRSFSNEMNEKSMKMQIGWFSRGQITTLRIIQVKSSCDTHNDPSAAEILNGKIVKCAQSGDWRLQNVVNASLGNDVNNSLSTFRFRRVCIRLSTFLVLINRSSFQTNQKHKFKPPSPPGGT